MSRKAIAVILFVFLAIPCAPVRSEISFAQEPSTEEPYRIGVIYGFSGAAQVWSRYGRMGIELAVEEIKQGGGINGRSLEIIYEDSETLPAKSVSAYRKLVERDRVDAIIGNVWSIITNPLIPLTRQDKVVLLSPTVMDESVEGRSPYFFTMGHRVHSLRKPVHQFFDVNPDVKRVAFLCWDDAWGHANMNVWREVARERGVTITDTVCQGDYGNDYRTDITRLSRGKPDAIFVGMWAERAAKRMRELGVDAKIFSTNCVLEAFADSNLKTQLEGMYVSYWSPNEDFKEAFEKKFGEVPILEAHNHYEAVRSLAKALENKSQGLQQALRQVEYDGVAGHIDFTHAPFVNRAEGQLFQIRSGKLQPIS